MYHNVYQPTKKRNRVYYMKCLFNHVILLYMRVQEKEKNEKKKKKFFQVLLIRKHIYVRE